MTPDERETLATRLEILAFRQGGRYAGQLWTMGGETLPDGTTSASFCCSCDENAHGVRVLIDAVRTWTP